MFTVSLALNRTFPCPLDCLSLLIFIHSTFFHPNLVPIQPKSNQIVQIWPHRQYISFFFLGLTCTMFFIEVGTHRSVFLEGGCKCG